MKVSIVILNYNDSETTIKLVDSIILYRCIDHIIIVDNCSSDQSFLHLYEKYSSFPNIVLLQSDRNGGYGYGNNIGIRYSINILCCDYIIIANPDVRFDENTVIEMISAYYNLRQHKIGAVAPLMKDKYGNISKASAWRLPSFKDDIVLSLMVLHKLVGSYMYYGDSVKDNMYNFVDVLPGSFFMISAKAIQDVGLFDENVFLYCEERILAYKLKRKRYKNILLGQESYIHEHSISINKNINSEISKYKLLQKSKKVYHRNYLYVSRVKSFIFNVFVLLGVIEQYFWRSIARIIRRVRNESNDAKSGNTL